METDSVQRTNLLLLEGCWNWGTDEIDEGE